MQARRSGASGRAVDLLPSARDRSARRSRDCRTSRRGATIAVVGLGVGTLASYRTPGQQWTFYEIDPEVERIARTDAYFTYLRSCGDSCRVVLGDARLSLARAPQHGYGLIVLDAFSSDAIPIHLMTDEALGLYLSRLAPGGRAGVSHYQPPPDPRAGARTTRAQPRTHRPLAAAHRDQTITPAQFSSEWMVMARNPRRSRIAGDRPALDHAGDSAVDAVVDG